ncbi:MAG TPA: c-type cytochrome domain-containing protein, partial [Planctomycetaceae bacterium]
MRRAFVLTAIWCAILLAASPLRADDAGIEFFEKRIRPLLVTHCYECHSADAKKIGGGLLLDSREDVQKGGDSGAIVKPGDVDASLLIMAVRHTDDSVKMPPKGKLSAAAIADLEAWVKMGAPDPREKAAKGKAAQSWEEILRARRDWWSLHPVTATAVPAPKNAAWSDQPIDRFILTRLEAQGLAPAAPADLAVL